MDFGGVCTSGKTWEKKKSHPEELGEKNKREEEESEGKGKRAALNHPKNQ